MRSLLRPGLGGLVDLVRGWMDRRHCLVASELLEMDSDLAMGLNVLGLVALCPWKGFGGPRESFVELLVVSALDGAMDSRLRFGRAE